MQRVDRRHPDETAPRFVKAGAIDDDIDGAHVANLPDEKLAEIEVLAQRAQHDTCGGHSERASE